MGTLRLCILLLCLAAGVAHANCPDQRASCVLHEEGVALLRDGKHQQAAEKFAAAIAAEPTARSYLGYSQAVEALGQTALAYDMLVKAQKLSQAELEASGPNNGEVNARAERIKYKLGELRAKVAFAWLRLPPNVPPARVVAVQREGEGPLATPFTQWIAVAPGKQVLVATLDDGTTVPVTAQVAAGSQGVVVIPVQAPAVRPGVPPVGRPGVALPPPEPPRKPVYKKWWFWTLVVVGVIVIFSVTRDSSSDAVATGGFRKDMFGPTPAAPAGGMTLFRF